MSYSPELSPINYSEEEEDVEKPSAKATPTIKLKLKLNPLPSASTTVDKKKKHKKKSKKKHKRSKQATADDSDGEEYAQQPEEHVYVGGKRPFASLQQEQQQHNDQDYYQHHEEDSETESYHPTDTKKPRLGSSDYNRYDASSTPLESVSNAISSHPTTISHKKGRRSSSMKSNAGAAAAAANGEKPKKRGRPTNKAKAAAIMAAMPPKVPEVPKKDTKSILTKLLDNIQKRDAYGFFLEPVDPKLVPDYLKVIKVPMDFSTMRKNIEAGKYQTGEDFRHDFELIISNAKIYNSRETIYWKSADKIHDFGIKLIDRAAKQIEEEKLNQAALAAEAAAIAKANAAAARASPSAAAANEDMSSSSSRKMSISFSKRKESFGIKEEDVDIMGIDSSIPALRKQSRQGSEIHTRETSVDIASSRAMTPIRSLTSPYKKKKKKVADTGVLYGPDGSLHTVGGVSDLDTLLPKEHPFADPPQLTIANPAALPSAFFLNRHSADDFFHNKHLVHSAHFCDYGPFTTLGGQPPGAFYTALDASYIYPLYGDDRGEAYMKSIWDFLDEDDDVDLVNEIEQKANHLTRGAWRVVQQTLERKNDNLEKKNTPLDQYPTIDTEFGKVEAAAIVDKIESKLNPPPPPPPSLITAPQPTTSTESTSNSVTPVAAAAPSST